MAGDILIVDDGDECPDGYERVQLKASRSWGIAIGPKGVFKEVVNYLADGRIDHSRSHYTINGRHVNRSTYRRRRDAPLLVANE